MNDIIKNHRKFVANQIEKSFDSGISVPQELDIEKAKWNVGDEKTDKNGVTWVVGAINASGVPLWRKKNSGSSLPKTPDPRDGTAKNAGFKDYAEMKKYQEYVTLKNLLKKESTTHKEELKDLITQYERDNADLIKRLSERRNVDSVQKSIGFESADSLIEKAKWKVGDEKQYQGVTWVVGGFNAKGAPLWRKKKDSGSPAGGSGSAAPAAQSSAPAAKTPAAQTSAPTTQNAAPQTKSPADTTSDKAVKIAVKGWAGKELNLISSDDPVKNRIMETLKDRLVFPNVKSVDDVLDKTKDYYEMKVFNRLNNDRWEIVHKDNNTLIRLKINLSDDNSKIKVVEHEGKSYGQSDIDKHVGDFNLETSAPAASQTSKTSTPNKDIPFEGLKKHKEVFDYAKTLTSRGIKFKEVKSDFGDKNSKAFVLSYPSGLDLKIDFLNNNEYVYNFSKNGDTLLGTNSTRDNEETDWSVMLDPDRFASRLISNISSSIRKWKSMATRYERTYQRTNKSSDYYKYSDAASHVNSLERRRDAAEKILQLS